MNNEILKKIDDNIISQHTMEFAAKPPKYDLPTIKFLVKKDNNFFVVSMLNRHIMNYPNKMESSINNYPIDVVVYDLNTEKSSIMSITNFISEFSLQENNIDELIKTNDKELDIKELMNVFGEIVADKNNINIEKYNNAYYPNIVRYLSKYDSFKKYLSLFSLSNTDELPKLNENLNTQEKYLQKISDLLDIPTLSIKSNSKRVDNLNATYYYSPSRNGKSMIVADDGSYLLTISSAINYEKLLDEFNTGRRNGNFNEDKSLTIKCHFCGKDIVIDTTNIPKNIKTLDTMCPNCKSFIKYANSNYVEGKTLTIKCHSCGKDIVINTTNIPKNIKTLDTMCPNCKSFIKYGNPNYVEDKKCFHNWVITDKLLDISKEWVKLPDGTKKEVFYHMYKCSKCNEEKRMSEEEFNMNIIEGPKGISKDSNQINTPKEVDDDINKKLNEASSYIFGKDKDFEKAKSILFDIINEASSYDNDSKTDYYNFNDVIDFVLYTRINKPSKNIKWIGTPFSNAYNCLAYIYNEEKNYDEALKMVEKSIKWNPMSLYPLFEKCETYKMQNNWEEFKKITVSLYDKIYNASDLAHYYRNLGFYYIEMNDLNLAYALYSAAIKFEKNKSAYSEMLYINQQLNRDDYQMSSEEGLKLLNDNNIQFGIKQENLNRLTEIYSNEKELMKKPKVEMQLAERIYFLTKDRRFVPFVELIDKTTNCSIIIPRSWKLVKEDEIKTRFNGNIMFAIYTDNNAFFQASYDGKCSKEQFEEAYNVNINNIKKADKYNAILLDEGITTLKLQQGIKEFKRALFDVSFDNKTIRIIHYFTLINEMFVDFTMTLDEKIDYNDKETFNNQENMRDIINLLSNIIEIKEEDGIKKISNSAKKDLLNKIDNKIVELTNQEFEQMNANFKNNNDISNVFDYTDTLFKKTKTNDPYWIDLAKETLNYVIIRLLETKDNLNYNTLMEVINNKSEFISICKSATTTIHNPDIIKIVEHIKNATDKMLDSFYSIIKEQFTPNNEMTSYNIKFDNDLCFNISIPKEFDSIKRVNDKTYQIGNGISVITIINARCNSEELLKTRAKEWLANSADTNRQIITDNLDKEYTLKNNQLKVVEKVATKDNKKRYYKFIYYNQTMLIFAYNDSDLSNTVDNIIVSIKAVKNQIKTERDPFANPNQ